MVLNQSVMNIHQTEVSHYLTHLSDQSGSRVTQRDKAVIEACFKERGWCGARIIRDSLIKSGICEQSTVLLRTSGSTCRKRGSGRPRTAKTETNKDYVEEAIVSQEDKPGTRKSQRKFARDLGIARSSVQNSTKELEFKPFKRITVSRRDETVKQKRKTRSKKLYSRYSTLA